MSTQQEQRRERALSLGAPFGLKPEKVTLPLMAEDPENIKGLSVLARRAGAASFAILLAQALLEDEDNDDARFETREKSKSYGVDYDMTPREISLLHGDNGERDLVDIVGTSESLAMVIWMLGGIAAPLDPTKPSDMDAVHGVVKTGGHIQGLIEKANLPSPEEIATVIDLYRLYAEQGVGDAALVHARRVALEWSLVRESDWLRVRF